MDISIIKCEDELENKYNLTKILNGTSYELIKNKENKQTAYIRQKPIKYIAKYKSSKILFKMFSEQKRSLLEFLCVVPLKYKEQEEERLFINLDVENILPANAPNSLGLFFTKKYIIENIEGKNIDRNLKEGEEILLEAMYIQSAYTYIEIKERLPKYIYIYLKDNIKIHKIENKCINKNI